MFAKINHVAIVSEDYALLTKYYESLFGMYLSNTSPKSALTVGDGYVGLNINPRKPGRPAGLDHFGIEVEDVDTAFDRMRTNYPDAKWVQRPSNRPFAGITANDPDGNVFDISQRQMKNRHAAYVENSGEQQERCITHMALRTLHPDETARFYSDVFELKEQNKESGDPNHYLTDGKMTLVLIPWQIQNFVGQSILPTGADHFCFTVESLDKLKEDIEDLNGRNPMMFAPPVAYGPEGKARLELLERQAPYADMFISDPDYTMIAIRERN
ncbi:MAG: hypothetical protein RLZ98_2196 [Pseudomonadota bacterium]|jgi:catechol 2,3-dioxygenase-like lactoylglutathione lyase family enzyme